MKRIRLVALIATVVVALAGSTAVVGAQAGKQANTATEVGVTANQIRIAVIADVDTPIVPGIFRGSVDAVRGFANYMNANGGLAGRKVVVDFIDSKLNANEARNAMIKACSQDFAMVGTSALFVDNIDDIVGCKNQAGQAIGIPDIPAVTTDPIYQCSPVSFPISPPSLVCATKAQHPQTFQANVGRGYYYQKKYGKDLHGIYIFSGDLRNVKIAGLTGQGALTAIGIKSDTEFDLSGQAPQSAYTPVAQSIKNKSSNYAQNGGTFGMVVELRKEATLQGVNSVKVWDCTAQCYDLQFLTQGGSDIASQYVSVGFVPFAEASSNKMTANYVKYTGKDKVTGLGVGAWAAGILLRDAVNAAVKQGGNNALTRKAVFDALGKITAFNADGMIGTTNIAKHEVSPCFALLQVQGGKFVRVFPSKAGTFNCDSKNLIRQKLDLLGS
jgi:hypothetical protein